MDSLDAKTAANAPFRGPPVVVLALAILPLAGFDLYEIALRNVVDLRDGVRLGCAGVALCWALGRLLAACLGWRRRPPQAPETTPQSLRLAHECGARLAAEAGIRAREEVLAIASHELRTPLHTIALSAHHLDRLLQGHLQAVPHVRRIIQCAQQMLRLVEDMLAFHRLETEQLSLCLAPLEMETFWQDVTNLYAGAGTAKGVQVRLDLPRTPWPKLLADRQRLLQIFNNLVQNAIKFTPAGGHVQVRGAVDGSGMMFSVSDTGVGMQPAQIARMFNRFWQGQRADHSGLGLGLHIAKTIVEAHGGRIWASSVPQQGTSLHFSLPARE